ncbi:hypothetical protein [Alphaentomopoxvirus acuprea]|uniref:Uncharacterized protein n=1 Tax=Alphaentomopoxvirus acuprea TaxID=62099 RepID=W6JJ26_9POXV|nr:hypothetical protein BA82_gp227 [Anomala cuprea entomopoxvirus]BAO49587.1 hypothetical protein [Anomala cuprea entomopoxvirus]
MNDESNNLTYDIDKLLDEIKTYEQELLNGGDNNTNKFPLIDTNTDVIDSDKPPIYKNIMNEDDANNNINEDDINSFSDFSDTDTVINLVKEPIYINNITKNDDDDDDDDDMTQDSNDIINTNNKFYKKKIFILTITIILIILIGIVIIFVFSYKNNRNDYNKYNLPTKPIAKKVVHELDTTTIHLYDEINTPTTIYEPIEIHTSRKPNIMPIPIDITTSKPDIIPIDITTSKPDIIHTDITTSKPDIIPIDITTSKPDIIHTDITTSKPDIIPIDITTSKPDIIPIDITTSKPDIIDTPLTIYINTIWCHETYQYTCSNYDEIKQYITNIYYYLKNKNHISRTDNKIYITDKLYEDYIIANDTLYILDSILYMPSYKQRLYEYIYHYINYNHGRKL